jgi:hypothetical protein
MPVLPATTDTSAEMVFRMLVYALDPVNGYTGNLVKNQFRVGLVPKEVQDAYPVYGSIYDSSVRTLETNLSVMNPLEPNDTEEIVSQRAQVSLWGPTHDVANVRSREIRELLRNFETPISFPFLVVSDLLVTNVITIQEETHVWHCLFDVVLNFQI